MILNNDMVVVGHYNVQQHNEINFTVKQYLKLAPFFMKPINSNIIDSYIVDITLLSANFSIKLNKMYSYSNN